MAIAHLDAGREQVRFCGVGNISADIVTREQASQSLVSQNGTVGFQLGRVTEFTYPWPQGAVLIMHSDGLATRWRLDSYPGLLTRDAALIAGVLYRDFTRGRDDVTVVSVRTASEGWS